MTERADRSASIDGVSLAAYAAIQSLPVGERVSFVLHDLFGVQFGEIEALLGLAACELAEQGRARLRADFTSTD
jgi:RNA polymerase sigma-70 factor (ECF subfamily)